MTPPELIARWRARANELLIYGRRYAEVDPKNHIRSLAAANQLIVCATELEEALNATPRGMKEPA